MTKPDEKTIRLIDTNGAETFEPVTWDVAKLASVIIKGGKVYIYNNVETAKIMRATFVQCDFAKLD